MQRKIPTTFTIGLDLLERLTKVAADERVTKSFIVRNAIERELRRYQRTQIAAAPRGGAQRTFAPRWARMIAPPRRRLLSGWRRSATSPRVPDTGGEAELATQAYFERRIADASRLFLSAAKRAEAYGPLDPRLATALNNLGEFYRVQGEFAHAEPYYWRAITIDEQALGADHMHLARDLNNLALLYRAQGRYADAEPLCQRALEIKETALGAEHPKVMAVVNNLLALYLAQGKCVEAEPLYRRALAHKAKTFGRSHPAFTTSLSNYSALVRKTRGDAEAAKLEFDVLNATDGGRRDTSRISLVASRGR